MKNHMFATAFALCAAIASPSLATAEELTAQSVIATVNGTEITLGNMIAARRTLPDQYQSLPGAELFKGILEQMIQQEVLSQSVGEPNTALKTQMENEMRAILAGAALQKLAESAVTEEAVKAFYDETYADFEPSREFRAAHILVETEDEAKALVTDLEAGADFADLARQKSTGPSGPNGGDLGWFGKGAMVPSFEEAVVAMDVGAISVPVQTQFGWHVIKLVETRLQEVPPLEQVRGDLEDQLRDKAMRDGVDVLTKSATVEQADVEDLDAIKNDALLND